MRRDVVVKGKGLAGSSDLTLLASIKPGFVPALDAVTYKSRVKRLLKTLHLGRSSSHEYALVRPISDAVERVGRIHSVRVLIVEADDKILLSASFDGSWEAYFRVLWQKTGRLLDAIYCNTVDYVTAWDHSYEEWREWARRVQLETDFFYGVPGVTVDDDRYRRDNERRSRRHPARQGDPVDADLENMRYVLPSVEEAAKSIQSNGREDLIDGMESITGLSQREMAKQSVQALVGLYALTDLYVPTTADGDYLERAAVEYLTELSTDFDRELLDERIQHRFERQVAWFLQAREAPWPAIRMPPALPPGMPAFDRDDVQGGIVEAHPGQLTHGCALLLGFDDAAAAAAFLSRLLDDPAAPKLTTASGSADPVKRNLAFTFEGLRACGLDEAQLAIFPDEFRHGMAVRAGQIGDLRTNHPRRWARPRRHGGAADDRIDLDAVHAVLQLRVAATPTADSGAAWEYDVTLPGNPLHAELAALVPAGCGTHVLAVESMRRQYRGADVREHFGFVDGNSQPTINPADPDAIVNRVQLGEMLIGYDNESDHAPDPALDPERAAWLHNGSFLVVRKLRQFVDRLEQAVDAASTAGLDKEEVYGKLVGRKRDGTAMVTGTATNNFRYTFDPQGQKCPLHAHIRRANPRTPGGGDGRRMPRIVRRGMSYGRPYDTANPGAPQNQSERGTVFMAYNASIGEQFEVVQRWLAGGNSTGSTSGQSDPLLGVPENGRQRWFQFEHDEKPVRMALDGSDCMFDDPKPFVTLEWGAYFFAPSMSALKRLHDTAAARVRPAPVWNVAEGRTIIQSLLALGCRDRARAIVEWKRVLEDVEAVRTFVAASVWAAIRADHGGLLRTPYGVLVADGQLVHQVLDQTRLYSVRGYLDRMGLSIGEDHLGLDDTGPGCPYRAESRAINEAIEALDVDDAFRAARAAVHRKIAQMVDDARSMSEDFQDPRFELVFDPREVIDEMLADLCERWFGIGETPGGHFERGGMHWDWQPGEPPFYPGHFGASSRYIFQPQPREEVVRYGIDHGVAVRTAMRAFIDDLRAGGALPAGPVGAAACGPLTTPVGSDQAARALAGAIMGFVPTVDGALRRVLAEWTGDGTFWAQRALCGRVPFADLQAARDALSAPMTRALQLRPMPELIWRTANAAHALTGTDGSTLEVQAGDVVVLSLVSSLQQELADGGDDIRLMFGGDRSVEPHPTHACPGRAAGEAAMLGVLAALVECDHAVRPGPAVPTLVIEGDTSAPTPRPPLCVATAIVAPVSQTLSATFSTPLPAATGLHAMNTTATAAAKTAPATTAVAAAKKTKAASQGTLLAWGDSWLSYRSGILGAQSNLYKELLSGGYTSAPQSPFSEAGRMLDTMASRPLTEQVYEMLSDLIGSGATPKAVLLSCGGNDCVKTALLHFVRDKATGTDIDATAWAAHLSTLSGDLRSVFAKIDTVAAKQGATTPINVVLHGYDHPIPDGRYLSFGPLPIPSRDAWIYGWLVKRLHYTVPEATDIMRRLIDGLNGMMKAVAGTSGLVKVVHVDLTKTLRKTLGVTGAGQPMSDAEWFSTGYKLAWENELHPTPEGFRQLGRQLKAALDAL